MNFNAKAVRFVAVVCTFAVTLVTGISSATPLRSPQIPVQTTRLQDYFNLEGQSINVLTDQYDIQCWATTVSNNATLTLTAELTATLAPQNSFGIYNCADGASPTLYEVFSGSAQAGWFAVASFFANGSLVVNVFDASAALQGTNVYNGVNRASFGFYLKNDGGTYYSQDARNGGFAHALVYAGTGTSAGQWWLCWEDLPFQNSDLDFEDMVIFLESVNPPLPVLGRTWSAIKSLY